MYVDVVCIRLGLLKIDVKESLKVQGTRPKSTHVAETESNHRAPSMAHRTCAAHSAGSSRLRAALWGAAPQLEVYV